MSAPTRFYVPEYYSDPIGSEKANAVLEQDAARCYDAAKRGLYGIARAILQDWTRCKEVVNTEAKFSICFWGQLFIEAYLLLPTRDLAFENWIKTVFKPCAYKFYYSRNNQGSWGILADVLADKALSRTVYWHLNRLREHMNYSFDDSGKMVYEVKRTNSGMWYSYFSLAPMLRACQLIPGSPITKLLKPLAWLFKYCINPNTWPYKLWRWPFSIIQRMIWPCADEVKKPEPWGWGGNLYYEAGKVFKRPEWRAWAKPPFGTVSIFRQ